MTLFRSDAKTGPFNVVPNGSVVMSPMNRVNPDLSEDDGHFGWDVLAGFYKVRVEKAGCHAPGAAGTPSVETTVMTIPPPVTNLDIRLQCDPVVTPRPDLPTLVPGVIPLRPRIALRLPVGASVKAGRDGRVVFKTAAIDCPPAAAGLCSASVALTASVPPKGKRKRKAKAVAVGAAKLTLAPGKGSIVEAKLSKAGLMLLAKLRRLKATVAVAVTAPGVDPASGSFPATLKSPARKKKK